jgi:hypothetical protein
VLLGLALVAFIASRVMAASRNIVFWDEFDTVLGFVLRLDSAAGWRELAGQFFALESEHRTVTSRLIVATLFRATGTVNFHVLCALGNAFLVGLCVLLVAARSGGGRRARLAAALGLGLFHLGHYEPFLWSGASMDHFLVLLLAGAACVALEVRTRLAGAGAVLLATLATFTLAHGCLVWIAGAGALWQLGRARLLRLWLAGAAVALGGFFSSFHIEASHRLGEFSPALLGKLLHYWLVLLGGPLTLSAADAAPWGGAALLAVLAALLVRGAWRREPALVALTLFAVGSLALVAFGRLAVAGPRPESRYLVLASLAWSLTAFLALEPWAGAARRRWIIAPVLTALAGFNLAANVAAAPLAETFLVSRDYAAVRFKQFGEEGHAGGFQLHPDRERAKAILAQTSARGIYRLPRLCEERAMPEAAPNAALVTYVTDLTADARAVGFEGWAMLPDHRSFDGEIHVVLRSERSTLVFSTLGVARPDVARAFHQPLWHYCGYNFVVGRSRLPAEKFQIGLMLVHAGHADLKMTDRWIDLRALPPTAVRLASAR